MRWIAPEWNWNRGYEAYKEMKSDMFIVVHADGCLLWVADADVVHDIVGRRDDFPKPIHVYGVLDIFGKNVVTTTGPLWRIHRKITSPQFNERNNR